MTRKRLYDILTEIPVDSRTLLRAVRRDGMKVTYIGKSGPLVSEADYERIKHEGIPYYQDRMTNQGIK